MKKAVIIALVFVIGFAAGYWLRQCEEGVPCNEQFLGKVIPYDLQKTLLNYAKGDSSKFILKGSKDTIDANTYTIQMTDWIVFLNQLNAEKDSLMFYPGIKTGHEICYMMKVIRGSDVSIRDSIYYVVSANVPANGFQNIEQVDSATANKYFNTYRNTIQSLEYDVSNEYRPARTYSVREILAFIRLNGVQAKQADPAVYANWKFSITGSAIDMYIANEIASYWPDELANIKKEDQIGFTIVFNVINADGQQGTAFEIGKPCPPRCGELRAVEGQ